jgi:hypothetical protein
MTQDEAFKSWWYNEGSKAPYTHHDCEEHTMRMCEIAWANGAYKAIAELESQERNFCPRCGKRTPDLTHIHTCTPPQD